MAQTVTAAARTTCIACVASKIKFIFYLTFMLKLYPALILAALLLFSCSNSDDKDSVYTCNGIAYAPPYQTCEGNILKIQCGNNYYNPATQFCSEQDNLVYDKCEGKDYNTEEHACENAILYDFCDTLKMNPATQFCHYRMVYDKCGGEEYWARSGYQICENDIVKNKCSDELFYDPKIQFCNNSIIFDKCNGAEYNPLFQICEDNAILSECEDKWYDPSKEQCIRNTFKTETFVDRRDGITYKYVQIGTQVWMAENLNYDAGDGSVCYEEKESNCTTYGRLYGWATAMALPENCYFSDCSDKIQPHHRGICPMDWHLPSTGELDVLVDYVGDFRVAGIYLKATNGWGEGWTGLDKHGFAALPGGYVSNNVFSSIGGRWWSSTSNSNAYYMFIYEDGVEKSYIGIGWSWPSHSKMGMFSVRCIHD
jgi:uncharacterized protein (TIGR02145 family)